MTLNGALTEEQCVRALAILGGLEWEVEGVRFRLLLTKHGEWIVEGTGDGKPWHYLWTAPPVVVVVLVEKAVLQKTHPEMTPAVLMTALEAAAAQEPQTLAGTARGMEAQNENPCD